MFPKGGGREVGMITWLVWVGSAEVLLVLVIFKGTAATRVKAIANNEKRIVDRIV